MRLNILISILFLLGTFGCASFNGPGDLKSPEYHSSTPAPLATPTATEPKKAKIQNDFEHSTEEASDDEGDQSVFEHLPEKSSNPNSSTLVHFDWPVDEAKLSRGFINTKRKHHWGLDLANKKGTSILAAESGYVVYTGRQFHGYGRLIVIEHNDQWATLYAHLEKFLVKEGDFVKKGQSIGEMGRSGHATGSHLHFELRDNRKPVDPIVYLPAHE